MKKLFIVLIILPVFLTCAHAENIMDKASELMGVDELYDSLPAQAAEISGRIDSDGKYDVDGALRRLWNGFITDIKDEIDANIKSFFSLIMLNLLCAMCYSLCQDKKISEYINITGICAVSAMFMGNMDSMVNQTVEALMEINTYSKLALPTVFTAAAASGSVVSASARYAALSVGLEIIINAARSFIVPLIYSFLALSMCKALFDDPLIKAVQRFIKWLMGISMTILTLIFSLYISLTGAISGSADALAIKTARTVISNVLPVVGGMISDAASTVLSAANMIKTSAGALSLVAICALCAGPFAILSVKMLLFKLAAAACDMIQGIRLSAYINEIGTALSFLLGLLGSISIMLFISVMSVIKAVSG